MGLLLPSFSSAFTLDCQSNSQIIPNDKIITEKPNLPVSHLPLKGKWVAFELSNNSDKDCKRWLEAGSTGIGEIQLYFLKNDQWQVLKSGPKYPVSEWNIKQRAPIFELDLPANTSNKFYLWSGPHHSSLFIAPKLWEASYFQNLEAQHAVINGSIYGAMLLLVLASLSLALIYRLPALGYMALGVGFYSLYTISRDNYFILHLWPNSVDFNSWIRFAFLGFTFAFANRYVCSVFKIKKLTFVWSIPFYFAVIVFTVFALTAGLIENNTYLLLALSLVDLICRILWIPAVILGYRLGNLKGIYPALLLMLLWLQTSLIIFNTNSEASATTSWLASSVLVGGLLLLATLINHMRKGRQQEIKAWEKVVEQRNKQKAELEVQVENRTQELKGALLAAENANQVKTDFLARVSHDLRSPLTVILGYAQLIYNQESSPVAKKANIIINSGRRLLDLVNDLISYAENDKNPNNLDIKPIYALSYFNSLAEEASFLAKLNNNKFSYKINSNLPSIIELDSHKLHKILYNLLSNACKFTQDGKVSFTINYLNNEQNQDRLFIIINDTGAGIPTKDLNSIFDPFARFENTKDAEGLGLGLAIAKQWSILMKGNLSVESQVGKGTSFYLDLPVSASLEDKIPHQDAFILPDQSKELDGKGNLIWLVEDSEYILEFLKSELESYNFVVQSFWSGAAAMAAITSEAAKQPDLLITDYNLPQYKGSELAKSAKKRWPKLNVLLISAGYLPNYEEDKYFDAVLLKPIELNELRKHLASFTLKCGLEPNQSKKPIKNNPLDEISLLSADEAAELNELLSISAITDILHWCEQLAEEKPELKTLLDAIWQLTKDLELDTIKQKLS